MFRSISIAVVLALSRLPAAALVLHALTPANGRLQAVNVSPVDGTVSVLFQTDVPAFQTVWANSIFDPSLLRWFIHQPEDSGALYIADLVSRTTVRVPLSIGPSENYVDLAYDSSTDTLFGLMETASGSKLMTIDYRTGVVTPLIDAPTTLTTILPGQSFDASGGRFFYANGSALYIFDVRAQTVSELPLPPPPGYLSMQLTYDAGTATLFGVVSSANPTILARIDTQTAAITRIATLIAPVMPEIPRAYDAVDHKFFLFVLVGLKNLYVSSVDVTGPGTHDIVAPVSAGERYVLAFGPAPSAGPAGVPALSRTALLLMWITLAGIGMLSRISRE